MNNFFFQSCQFGNLRFLFPRWKYFSITGERPFKCDAKDCGKSFTRNEELTRHKRIHTGLRPHACIICGKCFGRKDHLKKHMRTHENRDPYRMSTATLGMIGLGNTLPQGFFPYFYPTWYICIYCINDEISTIILYCISNWHYFLSFIYFELYRYLYYI